MAAPTAPSMPAAPAPRPASGPPANPPVDREATDKGIAQLQRIGR